MNPRPQNMFFLGKGGVGKSTVSALTALSLSDDGFKVLLMSMDPAHNQSDIFGIPLSEKPYKLDDRLTLKEVDIEWWVKKYVNRVQREIKDTYNYLTALNLENYFDVIKFSPGIEEYALLLAFCEIRKQFAKHDFILFDMPPTALTLKFFGLPKLSVAWLNKLQELRELILKKRGILSRIQLGEKEWEQDKILNRLKKQMVYYQEINAVFSDQNLTSINLVMNTDLLSANESQLIKEQLSALDIKIANVIINKYRDNDVAGLESKFLNTAYHKVDISNDPLTVLSNLREYLKNRSATFTRIAGA